MIYLLIKSYHDILLLTGISAICAFFLGIYFILRKMKSSSHSSSDDDFFAIAGEDVMVTQLDLARAYIETDKKSLAKQILASVVVQGNATQQSEAKRLLNTL